MLIPRVAPVQVATPVTLSSKPSISTHSIPVSTTNSAPVPAPVTTIKKTKLKSNLLDILKQEVDVTSQQEVKIITLNNEVVAQLFKDFIVHLETELVKTTAAQQMKLARVECISEKEITVWCSSEINKVMVNTQKDVFSDYVKSHTKQPDIRIQIDLDQNLVVEERPVEKKRTKFDIFESMAEKNPILVDLRKSLNLIFE